MQNDYQKIEPQIEQKIQEIDKELENEKKFQPFSVADILKMEFNEEPFLVEKLIPNKSLCVLSGYPESGKGWIILELARSVASGTPFLGRFQTQQGKVLIVDEENGLEEFQRRMNLLKFDSNLPICFSSQRGFKVDSQEDLKGLLEFVKNEQIKLVIFDPFVAIHSKRENEAGDMQKVMEALQEFNLIGASVLFAHHHRKELGWSKINPSQSLRGSSVLFGRVDSHLAVEKKEKEGEITLIMNQEKLRRGKKISPFQVNLVEEDGRIKLEYIGEYMEEKAKIEQAKELILKILEEGTQTKNEIREKVKQAISVSDRTFNEAFSSLRKSGEVIQGGEKEEVKPSGRKQKVPLYILFSQEEYPEGETVL